MSRYRYELDDDYYEDDEEDGIVVTATFEPSYSSPSIYENAPMWFREAAIPVLMDFATGNRAPNSAITTLWAAVETHRRKAAKKSRKSTRPAKKKKARK